MKKLIKYFFVLFGLFVSFSIFGANLTISNSLSSSSSKAFLETLSEEKTKVETSFDTSYTQVYQKFQTSIGSLISSLPYQSLLCLGVVNDTVLLQQMQIDIKNLKLGFMNAYTTLYSDALDIEQKQRIYKDTTVSLFVSGSSYESEKTRILNALTLLATSQKSLAIQYQQTYENKIIKLVSDFNDYTLKNKDVIQAVSNDIQVIQKVDQQYKKLTSDIIEYQNKLVGSGNKFFSNLNFIKQSATSGLDISLQNIINKELKRNKILKTLSGELYQQKAYAIGLFQLQIDEKLNMLLEKWYNNKEFTKISNDVKTFVSMTIPEGKLQCSNFVSSSTFLQETQQLSNKISTFSQSFAFQKTGVVTISGFQNSVMGWIPVINLLQKDITSTFVKSITEKKQSLLAEYRSNLIPSDVIVPDNNSDPKISMDYSFKFTNAFKKNQTHGDIKILQQLLTKLGFYNGELDSIYNQKTLEAVHKYQLSKNLLKGYEKKPSTWGWMGPSTRSELNKDIVNSN